MNEPDVIVRSIHMSYGSHKVLKGVDLTVSSGTIVGLVGPNGVGKTTLLHIIAGLIAPDRGEVCLLGSQYSDRQCSDWALGLVPEEPTLLEHLTPHELIILKGVLAGLNKTNLESVLPELLASWSLLRHEHELIKTLSHGMKQKLQILLALLGCPQILLLDEPLSGLDVYSAGVLKQLLQGQAKAGKTIIISSHVLSLVTDICHRMVILSEGNICFDGPVVSCQYNGPSLEAFVLSHAAMLPEPARVAAKINHVLSSLGNHSDATRS